MNANDKVKSLGEIFDDVEQMEIGHDLSEEDYKKLIHKIVYMLALAYDKGYADAKKN